MWLAEMAKQMLGLSQLVAFSAYSSDGDASISSVLQPFTVSADYLQPESVEKTGPP